MLEILLMSVLLAQTTASLGDDAVDPEIAAWALAAASGATEQERAEGLEQLRRASGGPPNAERTRAAIFSLQAGLAAAGPAGERERVKVMQAAVALYPDDPRTVELLRFLAISMLDDDDRYGAHYNFSRLLADSTAGEDAALLVRAAANAVTVGDGASAFRWTEQVDVAGLSLDARVLFWSTRLTVAASLSRHAEALEALARLDEQSPETVRRDAAVLLAAARAEVAVGRLASASDRYEAFLNIHPRHPERPAALLEHARLQAQLNRLPAALRSLDWLVEEHPNAPESDMARVERVEVDGPPTPIERAEAYRKAAEESGTAAAAMESCRRLIRTMIAEGLALEAVSILGWMAQQPSGFAALAARTVLIEGAEPAFALIQSRDDVVGLAAAAAQIEAAGLRVPAGSAASVREARKKIGLPTPDGAEEAVHIAEQFWREGRSDDALERIGQALTSGSVTPIERRSLLVLRADIRFAAGESEKACADYREAGALDSSMWVDRQLIPCEAGTTGAAEGES